jgi:hypothetical protein
MEVVEILASPHDLLELGTGVAAFRGWCPRRNRSDAENS